MRLGHEPSPRYHDYFVCMTMTYVCVFSLFWLWTDYEICYICELVITCECEKLLWYLLKILWDLLNMLYIVLIFLYF